MKYNSRIRRIADYVAATENEIAVDVNFLGMAGLGPATVGYLPRSPKWVALGRRYPFWTRWLWRVLWLFWVAGGGASFFLMQILPHWRTAVTPADEPIGAVGGAVVAFSSRVGDIVTDKQFPDFPRTWYTMPWAPLRATPVDAVCIDIFSLLSRAELWRAYWDAVAAVYFLLRRKRTRKWILQSYTAFRWFAVRAALGKQARQLVIGEHFDRWAVLADSVARAFKFAPDAVSGSAANRLVLVQHGSLAKLGDEAEAPAAGLRLYRRLRAVDKLYAYSPDAIQAFKSTILSRACGNRLEQTLLFSPGIELDGALRAEAVRILFVGSPMCEGFHRNVFVGLAKRRKFDGLYKPHPMAPMSETMRHVGWQVIDDPRQFPAVEILVAYESTLVVEYRALGIPSAVHPINIESNRTEEFLNHLCALLDAIDTRTVAA